MAENGKKKNLVIGRLDKFLQNKPVWAWWISYLVLTGGLFGIFYLAWYLLGVKPWLSVLLLIAGGIIWGSTKFYKSRKGKSVADKSADDYLED